MCTLTGSLHLGPAPSLAALSPTTPCGRSEYNTAYGGCMGQCPKRSEHVHPLRFWARTLAFQSLVMAALWFATSALRAEQDNGAEGQSKGTCSLSCYSSRNWMWLVLCRPPDTLSLTFSTCRSTSIPFFILLVPHMIDGTRSFETAPAPPGPSVNHVNDIHTPASRPAAFPEFSVPSFWKVPP